MELNQDGTEVLTPNHQSVSCIYLDNFASNVLVEANIVSNCSLAALKMNSSTLVQVRQNVLSNGHYSQIQFYDLVPARPGSQNQVLGNIISTSEPAEQLSLSVPFWAWENITSISPSFSAIDKNLYWRSAQPNWLYQPNNAFVRSPGSTLSWFERGPTFDSMGGAFAADPGFIYGRDGTTILGTTTWRPTVGWSPTGSDTLLTGLRSHARENPMLRDCLVPIIGAQLDPKESPDPLAVYKCLGQ